MIRPTLPNLQRIATWLAASVALTTALAVPLGYFLTVYRYESIAAQDTVGDIAEALSKFAYARPDTWIFEDHRLKQFLDPHSHATAAQLQLLTADGKILARQGSTPDWPTFAHRGVLLDGDTEIGHVEIETSLRPMLEVTAYWAILGLLLALGAFFALRLLPFRALARALRELDESHQQLQSEVAAKEHALQRAEETGVALRHMALHDDLTGLPNRTLFQDRLDYGIKSARRAKQPLAVAILDLDRFKEVNDSLGHATGDELLRQVGQRLGGAMRGTDTVARLGGDEFAVIIIGADSTSAQLVAQKILLALEAPFQINNDHFTIGASLGIALFPEHADESMVLLQRADVAMYQSKNSMRGGVALYNPSLDKDRHGRLQLINDLREALARDELYLDFQPKIDLQQRRVVGAEALARWRHPTKGLIPPDVFIPLAEHAALIAPLTLWVVNAALAQAARWRHQGLALHIAINLSAQTLQDTKLADDICRALRADAELAGSVTFEVTEGTLMVDPLTSSKMLADFRALGAKISVDDFGTGYSSLAYLKRLPLDELKIDLSFVKNMSSDHDDMVIVRSIVDLGHNLSLRVVAEGVEDKAACDSLSAMGCDLAQGYYLAKPMNSGNFDLWLRNSLWGPPQN